MLEALGTTKQNVLHSVMSHSNEALCNMRTLGQYGLQYPEHNCSEDCAGMLTQAMPQHILHETSWQAQRLRPTNWAELQCTTYAPDLNVFVGI